MVRDRGALAYDEVHAVVLVFGGMWTDNGRYLYGDTWGWDGNTWVQLATDGPSARQYSGLAYDPVRQITVLFGGWGAGGAPLGDTWEWNGAAWELRSTSGPAPRFEHSMVYDRSAGMCVVFGGHNAVDFFDDSWGWDGTDWVRLGDAGPSSRSSAGMCYDTRRGRGVLFGGQAPSGPWDAGTWETTWPTTPDFDGDGLLDGCDPDIDNDGVPNETDVCDYTPMGIPVNAQGRPMGDFNENCAVDFNDFDVFSVCLWVSGPGIKPWFQECEDVFDFDADIDVDLRDFAGFQTSFGRE